MQLRLAAKISRPVSVHCVKADGAIVDVLQSEIKKGHTLPPKICIHSFAGSVETLKRIVRLVEGRKKTKNVRLYLSFSLIYHERRTQFDIELSTSSHTHTHTQGTYLCGYELLDKFVEETSKGFCERCCEDDSKWNLTIFT